MLNKLKKAYVNFTVAFAVPLIVFSNVSGVYNGWRERQYEMFDQRELCAKLVKEGAVSQEFCDEEIKYETGPQAEFCLLYTSPSPRDRQKSRMPSSA